ncbi:TonB family protein [Algoriphagus sp.]|uniref:energy transducer TonB n=1 Tax=Algoriphagus sp. TaxID=1872435 RepID=UPI0039192E86
MRQSILCKVFILFLAFFGYQLDGVSQNTSSEFLVEGRVNNAQGEKAVGAVILVKGTTTGTVTDTMGNFSLKVPSEESILVISHFSSPSSIEVALKGGKNVVVRFGENSESNPQPVREGFIIHSKVDEAPSPREGILEWNKYLSKSIKYPHSARESKTQGTVVVGFKVKEDGTIADVEIIRGIGGECDEEAVRVIAEGPTWAPGKVGDQAVTTQLSLAVRFVLATDPGVASLSQQNEKAIADRFGKHLTVVGYQVK